MAKESRPLKYPIPHSLAHLLGDTTEGGQNNKKRRNCWNKMVFCRQQDKNINLIFYSCNFFSWVLSKAMESAEGLINDHNIMTLKLSPHLSQSSLPSCRSGIFIDIFWPRHCGGYVEKKNYSNMRKTKLPKEQIVTPSMGIAWSSPE